MDVEDYDQVILSLRRSENISCVTSAFPSSPKKGDVSLRLDLTKFATRGGLKSPHFSTTSRRDS